MKRDEKQWLRDCELDSFNRAHREWEERYEDDSGGVQCPSCKTIWQDFQVDELEGTCKCGELLREEDDG